MDMGTDTRKFYYNIQGMLHDVYAQCACIDIKLLL